MQSVNNTTWWISGNGTQDYRERSDQMVLIVALAKEDRRPSHPFNLRVSVTGVYNVYENRERLGGLVVLW